MVPLFYQFFTVILGRVTRCMGLWEPIIMALKTSSRTRTVSRAWSAPSTVEIEAYYNGMRPFWHPVLPTADLPDDRPIGIELLGEKIALVRLNNQIVAVQDLCRHFQSQLSIGEIQTLPDGQPGLMWKYHCWHY